MALVSPRSVLDTALAWAFAEAERQRGDEPTRETHYLHFGLLGNREAFDSAAIPPGVTRWRVGPDDTRADGKHTFWWSHNQAWVAAGIGPETFDVVCMDGWRSAGRALADFDALLDHRRLDGNSIVLVPFVLPEGDSGAASPTPILPVGEWAGDIWRFVLALRARPGLQVKTLMTLMTERGHNCVAIVRLAVNVAPLGVDAFGFRYEDFLENAPFWLSGVSALDGDGDGEDDDADPAGTEAAPIPDGPWFETVANFERVVFIAKECTSSKGIIAALMGALAGAYPQLEGRLTRSNILDWARDPGLKKNADAAASTTTLWIVAAAAMEATPPSPDHLPDRYVLFQTEQRTSKWFSNKDGYYWDLLRGAAVIWDFDRNNCDHWNSLRSAGVIEAPAVWTPYYFDAGIYEWDKGNAGAGAGPLMTIPPEGAKRYDLFFAGWLSPRRRLILEACADAGFSLFVKDGYLSPDEWRAGVAASRLVLNIHFYDGDAAGWSLETSRLSKMVAHGALCLTEGCVPDDASSMSPRQAEYHAIVEGLWSDAVVFARGTGAEAVLEGVRHLLCDLGPQERRALATMFHNTLVTDPRFSLQVHFEDVLGHRALGTPAIEAYRQAISRPTGRIARTYLVNGTLQDAGPVAEMTRERLSGWFFADDDHDHDHEDNEKEGVPRVTTVLVDEGSRWSAGRGHVMRTTFPDGVPPQGFSLADVQQAIAHSVAWRKIVADERLREDQYVLVVETGTFFCDNFVDRIADLLATLPDPDRGPLVMLGGFHDIRNLGMFAFGRDGEGGAVALRPYGPKGGPRLDSIGYLLTKQGARALVASLDTTGGLAATVPDWLHKHIGGAPSLGTFYAVPMLITAGK